MKAASDYGYNDEPAGNGKPFKGLEVSMRVMNLASKPVGIWNGTERYRMLPPGVHTDTIMAPHLSEWGAEMMGSSEQKKWKIDFVHGVYQ